MAKRNFYVDIDLNQNSLIKSKVENLGTAPTTPVAGQLYFDTTLDQFGVYTSSGWAYLDSGNINNILGDATSGIQVSITNGVATISQLASSASQNGYMSSTDKSKLDSSTEKPFANTLVQRDEFGNAKFNTVTIIDSPVNATDGTNKAYVDGIAQGLSIKEEVVVLSNSNITLTGTQTVDTVVLVDGDRILLTGQTTASENGIWIVRSGAWERPSDFDTGDNVANAFMFVSEGSTYADTGWVCTNDGGSDVVGQNNLVFVQFSSAGVVGAGDGLIKTGNDIEAVAGDNSITINPNDFTVKRDTAGAVGLTASGILVNTDTNFITIDSNKVTIGNYTSRVGYATVNVGDTPGVQTITHNFGSENVQVHAIDNTTKEQVEIRVVNATTNTVQVEANGATLTVKVIITGNIGESL